MLMSGDEKKGSCYVTTAGIVLASITVFVNILPVQEELFVVVMRWYIIYLRNLDIIELSFLLHLQGCIGLEILSSAEERISELTHIIGPHFLILVQSHHLHLLWLARRLIRDIGYLVELLPAIFGLLLLDAQIGLALQSRRSRCGPVDLQRSWLFQKDLLNIMLGHPAWLLFLRCFLTLLTDFV